MYVDENVTVLALWCSETRDIASTANPSRAPALRRICHRAGSLLAESEVLPDHDFHHV